MNMPKRITICLLLSISIAFMFTSVAFARSQNEIIQSMKNRKATIKQLKTSGVVGETNKGYLAFVGGSGGQDAVVAAENQDRKELYALVAKKQNTSLSVVENNMGVVKAQRAKPGEFYQNSSGAWQKR